MQSSDMAIRVFSRLGKFDCFYFEYSSAHRDISFLSDWPWWLLYFWIYKTKTNGVYSTPRSSLDLFFFLIFFVKRYWSFRQAVFALSFKEKTATWSPFILRMLVLISCHNSLCGHFLIGADNEGESMDQEGPLQDEAVKLAAVWGKLRHWAG